MIVNFLEIMFKKEKDRLDVKSLNKLILRFYETKICFSVISTRILF